MKTFWLLLVCSLFLVACSKSTSLSERDSQYEKKAFCIEVEPLVAEVELESEQVLDKIKGMLQAHGKVAVLDYDSFQEVRRKGMQADISISALQLYEGYSELFTKGLPVIKIDFSYYSGICGVHDQNKWKDETYIEMMEDAHLNTQKTCRLLGEINEAFFHWFHSEYPEQTNLIFYISMLSPKSGP